MTMSETPKKLNIGCGKFPKEGYVNLDFRADVGADVVHDLENLPLPFADGTFSRIEADHVLEHMHRPFAVMRELARISAPGGIISIRVPHFSRGFSHPDHKCGFDVSLPLYFSPSFEGGYEDVELKLVSMKLTWFAQRYLKKVTLSSFQYSFGIFLSDIFDFFANMSPYACSRLWCFWVGGFEEIHYEFQVPEHEPLQKTL
jgi:SAM-dependent methyltransferase